LIDLKELTAGGLLDVGSKEMITRLLLDFSPVELTASQMLDLGSMVLITGTFIGL